jgi:GAF domain-containing protein
MMHPDTALRPAGELPLATAELATRPSRGTRPEAERKALVLISEAISESRDGVLQRLAETALDLCHAGSAGISVEEDDGTAPAVFRWRAVAGKLAPWLGGTMPRDFSPCGVVLDTGSVQLMTEPVRYYAYIASLPHVAEVLLVPVNDGARPIGTLWVVHHDDGRRFDRDDAHALERLARFAAAALQMSVAPD